MNNFLIINQYASTLKTGIGGRSYYLGRELARQGHKVYLVASSFTHLLREQPKVSEEFTIETIEDNFSFLWVRMPEYTGAHHKKRVWNWFSFSFKLTKLHKVIEQKPDVVVASSPSPFVFLGAQWLAKKYKAKLAFEVRDIWPLTLIELGEYSSNNLFIRLMQWVEDKAYRDSDIVISNLNNAAEHMVMRGMSAKKYHWIPNGFDSTVINSEERLPEKVSSIFPKDKFVVGYTGTVGVANALDVFIRAAYLLKDDDSIVFVVVGDGKEKPNLIKSAANLKNIIFIDTVPKNQVQTILSKFNICFLSQISSSIYMYGIASIKLPEYFLSARPVIHSTNYDSPVDKINAGIVVPAENPEAIIEAILKIKAMSQKERSEMGANGRVYVLKNHDYTKLAKKLAKIFQL